MPAELAQSAALTNIFNARDFRKWVHHSWQMATAWLAENRVSSKPSLHLTVWRCLYTAETRPTSARGVWLT